MALAPSPFQAVPCAGTMYSRTIATDFQWRSRVRPNNPPISASTRSHLYLTAGAPLDGGRATNGKLLLSGNGSSTIPVITVKSGKDSVRGIIGVRKKPAAAGPSAGRFWTTSHGTGNPVPMPK